MPLEYALQNQNAFPRADPWKPPKAVSRVLDKPLGLETIPQRIIKKARNRSHHFNVCVIGETGLGKTTFLNTLFNTSLTENVLPEHPMETKTVTVEARNFELVEEGVTLNLTVVDTPGFGDRLNRTDDLAPIETYINEQFDRYFEAEQGKAVRHGIVDTRVHVCLYFIPPTGIRLKQLDIETMKVLSRKANIVPVIARADSLTAEEMAAFKLSIMAEIKHHGIPVFPLNLHEKRDEVVALEEFVPFSVIGSDRFVEAPDGSGKKLRARSYKWGVVEVEHQHHCDFIRLRRLLMEFCLHDLVESTHSGPYANYRGKMLRSLGRPESILLCDDSYETRVEQTKRNLAEEMLKKEEEMRKNFVLKVKEKEKALKEREEMLQRKRNEFNQEIEEIRRELEMEQAEWDMIVRSQSGVGGGGGSKFGFGKR